MAGETTTAKRRPRGRSPEAYARRNAERQAERAAHTGDNLASDRAELLQARRQTPPAGAPAAKRRRSGAAGIVWLGQPVPIRHGGRACVVGYADGTDLPAWLVR
jgi:hypothetical protein